MSISIYVVAQRKVTQRDLDLVRLHNELVKNGCKTPDRIRDKLKHSLGITVSNWEEMTISDNVVEIPLYGNGNIMCGSGEIFDISALPPDVTSIRIYASH
jgi:hypothetical protein